MPDDHPAPVAASSDGAPEDTRRLIERWFSARGVPQLIEGYGSEQRIDARALPLIGAWILIGTVLIWIQRPGHTFLANLGAMLLGLAATGLLLGAYLWVRKHPPFGSRSRLDLFDIAVVGLVPGVVAALISGDPGAAPGIVTFVLFGVGVVYAVVALGVPELMAWGLRHLRENLPHIAMLVARTLPLLLILVVFLLFAAELWEVAHSLGLGDLAVVMVLLAAVGAVFVVTQATEKLRAIQERGDQMAAPELVAGTPAAGVAAVRSLPPSSPQRLRRPERLNLVVLMLVSQLVQSLFVALMVAVFLIVLGTVVVPASVQEAWTGAAVRDLGQFVLLGEPRMVSIELLVAAALLGGMTGLYFTGLALTDATYRAEFDARVVADVERIMAVRSVYLALNDGGGGDSGQQ